MNSSLLKILFTSESKKLEEKQKRRQAKAQDEREKSKTERKLWELAEEYEKDD